MKEREISLIDLIVEILLRWRVIIVWMLVGGIAMGAFSYVNSYRAQQAQIAAKEAQIAAKEAQALNEKLDPDVVREKLEKELTNTQRNNVEMALNYEEYARERREYLEASLLMQIDARQVPQSRIIFGVSSSDENQIVDIVRVYEDLVLGDMLEWLEKESGAEHTASNYSEVISLDRDSKGVEARVSASCLDALAGVDSFCVDVLHVTKEQAVELADLVVCYMNVQQGLLQETLGAHTIEVVNQSFAYVVDNTLLTTQRNYRNEVTTNVASAEKIKDAFDVGEKNYYEFLVSQREGYMEETQSVEESADSFVVAPPRISIKYVILGMVLFAFVYVFYLFVKYIFNTKLRTTDDVKEIYGIAQLGAIPVSEGKKKVFAFVDKWILKLRNYNKRVFSESEAIGLAAVAVKMAAKKESVDAVYCIGCDIQEKTETIAGQIGEILGKDNISYTLLNNVLYNQENMAKLADAKAVVLLEKVGETLYEEIANELELLQRQEIKVLGAIVVE